MLSNDKMERFCNEYIIDSNATQAAIRAGYSPHTACSQGSRLLKNVEVAKRISELSAKIAEKNAASADEVMTFLSEVMRGEIRPTKTQFKAAELLARRHRMEREVENAGQGKKGETAAGVCGQRQGNSEA